MGDEREAGISALNRDFSRFDQVNKPQSYRLSESAAGDEAFDEEFRIRECDMAHWFHGGDEGKRRFAQSLGAAMEEIGFAILTNHGIDPALFERADTGIRDFFETIPVAERMPYLARRHGSVNQGYFPIKETTIIHPDLVEGWVFCRRAFDLGERPDYDARAYWPRPEFEPLFRELVLAEERLILRPNVVTRYHGGIREDRPSEPSRLRALARELFGIELGEGPLLIEQQPR